MYSTVYSMHSGLRAFFWHELLHQWGGPGGDQPLPQPKIQKNTHMWFKQHSLIFMQ